MTIEEDARRRFLGQMESILGQPIRDDAVAREELDRALAAQLGGPVAWTDLERRWEALRPLLAKAMPSHDDAFLDVEDKFQAALERIDDAFEPDTLRRQSPGIRMLIATRGIEGQVANGGWASVFYNGLAGLLPLAIEGYGLLGLDERAACASRIMEHGVRAGADEYPELDALDHLWLALPSAERARAEFISAHLSEFRGG